MENILTGLDLPEEVATTLTERIEVSKAEWIEGAKNDSDFIGKIRKEEAAKFFKTMEKAYKRSFPDLNLDDIEGEGTKRMEAILKAGVAKLQDGKDQTNQELQQKYFDLNEQFENYKGETVPALLHDERTKYHAKFINEGILKDSLEFDTVCKAEVRPSLVDAYVMRQGWHKAWNEESSDYEFLTADNLKPTQSDKPLTKKDVIQLALDDAGVLKKSNGTVASESTTSDTRKVQKQTSDAASKYIESMPYTPRS